MITATFRGINLSRYLTINEITGRGVTPSSVNTIDLPGMIGVYAGAKKRLARVIDIKYTIKAGTPTDLRNKINELSTLLDIDTLGELKFSDEPGKVYFAILDGVPDSTEVRAISQGTLSFLCPDPYKYSDGDRNAILKSSSATAVTVSGTSTAEPVFEITALKDATSLTIQNTAGGKVSSMKLGTPSTIGSPAFDPEELILHSEGDSMTDWNIAPQSEASEKIDGNFSLTVGDDGDRKFYVDEFKQEPTTVYTGWHGPALKAHLPMQADDFIVDVHLELPNGSDPEKTGKVEYLLIDLNGNRLARAMVIDNSANAFHAQVIVEINGRTVYHGSADRVWNNFVGHIRLERRNNAWKVNVAKMNPDGSYHTRASANYNGGSGAALAGIIMAAHAYGDFKTIAGAIRDVKVYKLNTPAAETAVPVIFRAGDKIVIDHRGRTVVTINGRDARRYKQLTGIPFKLLPGVNNIVITPGGSFSGRVKWREAYK